MINKGFTLIELLAVIVILAIIAIITTPLISNVIDDSKKGAFKASSYGIIATSNNGYVKMMMSETNPIFTEYNYENQIEKRIQGNISVDYKGQKPTFGTLIINDNGNTAIAFYQYGYCATKSYSTDIVTVNKKNKEECIIEEEVPGFPTIELIGNDVIEVEINTEYQEFGYVATSIAGLDITDDVKIIIEKESEVVDKIDTSNFFSYKITYKIEEGNKSQEKVRVVNISDKTAPELIIPEDATLNIRDIPTYDLMAGVSATDNSKGQPHIKVVGTLSEL